MFKQGFNEQSIIIFGETLNLWSTLAIDISLKWEGVINYLLFSFMCKQKIISTIELIYKRGMKDDIQILLLF